MILPPTPATFPVPARSRERLPIAAATPAAGVLAPASLSTAAVVVLALLALAPGSADARRAHGPVFLAPGVAESISVAIVQERADTEEWLKSSPTSYLATVQRVDFGNRRALVVGSAEGSDVRIDDPEIAGRHVRVTVQGGLFRVQALGDTSVKFMAKDAPTRDAVMGPGSIKLGRFVLRLSHQGYPAIIVFDPQSPRFQDFKGLSYYPVNLGYRFELPLTPKSKPDTTIILSTRGHRRRAVRVGWFDFAVHGKPARLEVTRLLEPGIGEGDLSVFFRDATTGKETYEVGRYVDPVALGDGRYRLDFNLAYNPACAFSDHYNCPIPSKANTLKLAIEAGEKDSHYYDH